VNVFIMGALTAGLRSEEIAHLCELDRAGVIGFGDDKPLGSAAVLRAAFMYAKPLGKTVCVHCEDASLVSEGHMHEGVVSTILGLNGRPRSAEDIEVARAIILAEETGVRLHILHLSSAKSVEIVRQAKAKGLNVTAEVTPHHLILTDEAVMGYNTNAKVTPPIREISDREALREGLADGTIDCIATDHAPRCLEEKQVEFPLAGNGMIGLETAFSLLMTELVKPGLFDLKDIISALTVKPSRIYGLGKGTLIPGSDADITVIDPAFEWVVQPDLLESKSKNTPFMGKTLKGAPVLTMVGGKVVMKGRKIVA
ncbi:MAG: dihydroorotase, partial [Firmicutes bacterium]|nr:dihydroorotase [Bacillota bacterium]